MSPTVRCALLALPLTFGCVDVAHVPSLEREGPAPEAAAPASAPSLRVGAWNVRRLGLDGAKDWAGMARIIDTHFDLIALSEVMWTRAGPQLSALLFELGPAWSYHVTDSARPNLPVEFAEFYAVLYRTSGVAPCAEQPALVHVDDGDGRASDSRPNLFLREPAVGCYRSALGLELSLAVYHARWGDGDEASIAREVQQLDAALRSWLAQHPSERPLFVVGDFNLGPEALAELTSARLCTQGSGSTLANSGQVSQHLYDHLLAWNLAAEAALRGDARVLDVRNEANDPAAFRAAFSDHLPIVAHLQALADE